MGGGGGAPRPPLTKKFTGIAGGGGRGQGVIDQRAERGGGRGWEE